MANLDQVLDAAFADKVISGAVVLAEDTTGRYTVTTQSAMDTTICLYMTDHIDLPGKFKYEKTFGIRTTIDGHERPLETDAILFLASCTKLMTTIAALQCVERGLITMTEDISRVAPELASVKVLTGFDESTGAPHLQKRTEAITLEYGKCFPHALSKKL